MGHNGPKQERWTVVMWRGHAETIGQMHDQGWVVHTLCGACHLAMATDLKALIRLKAAISAYGNLRPPCRRFHCTGKVWFIGKPPGQPSEFKLEAPWPEGRKPVVRP